MTGELSPLNLLIATDLRQKNSNGPARVTRQPSPAKCRLKNDLRPPDGSDDGKNENLRPRLADVALRRLVAHRPRRPPCRYQLNSSPSEAPWKNKNPPSLIRGGLGTTNVIWLGAKAS